MSKLGDIIILSFFMDIVAAFRSLHWAAATTAMYYTMFKIVTDMDNQTIKTFFRSFKRDFKQSTIIWVIMLALGILIFGGLWFSAQQASAAVFYVFLICAAVIYVFVFLYVFPLTARFYDTTRVLFMRALLLSFKHFPLTIAMLVPPALTAYGTLFFPPLVCVAAGLSAAPISLVMLQYFLQIYPEKRGVRNTK